MNNSTNRIASLLTHVIESVNNLKEELKLKSECEAQQTPNTPVSTTAQAPASSTIHRPTLLTNRLPASASNYKPAAASNYTPAAASNYTPASTPYHTPASAFNYTPESASTNTPYSAINSRSLSDHNAYRAQHRVKRNKALLGTPLKKPKKSVPFMINKIIVLDKKNREKLLQPHEIEEHRRASLVSDFVSWDKAYSAEEVNEHLVRVLPVLGTCNYTVMRVEGQKVVAPNLPPNTEVDGERIHSLAYRSTLYIRPHHTLNKIRKTIFSPLSDSDEDVDDPSGEAQTEHHCSVGTDNRLYSEEPTGSFTENRAHSMSSIFNVSSGGSTESSVTRRHSDNLVATGPSTGCISEDYPCNRSTEEPTGSVSEDHPYSRPPIVASSGSLTENITQNSAPRANVQNSKVTVRDSLNLLRTQLLKEQFNEIEVNRTSVFDDITTELRRKSFHLLHTIRVTFTDSIGVDDDDEEKPSFKEEGFDLGGPTRELFTLGLKEIMESRMFGGDKEKNLNFNSNHHFVGVGIDNDYIIAGQFIAMSFLQGGPGPNFFSEELYDCVISGEIKNPTIKQIGSIGISLAVQKIQDAVTVDDLRTAISQEELNEAGMRSYATSLGQKETFVKQAVHYFAEFKVRPILLDLCEGLSAYGFLETIRCDPELYRPFFTPLKSPMTKKEFSAIFNVRRSEPGHNNFVVENSLISYWNAFLKDCEEGIAITDQVETTITISELLSFCTGTDRVPPGGFPIQPVILFNHGEPELIYPKANTCIVTLYLPVKHQTRDDFKYHLCFGVRHTKGFGLA